ncbi:hypothetical protein [Acinetobacter pittii]|uniref:hypothetical protein n=1 Tax=Acinetobacter pittii TaxID=48296 RepID=UPI0024DE6CE4|nr:hypothetical protein [Acinetobacter pittii]
MNKLVIFAEGSFKHYLMEQLSENKYPFLKEIESNRLNLSIGTRYKFELTNYSVDIQSEINNLNDVMELLNKNSEVISTMKPY